jgi:hypothetical protein
MGKKLAFSVTTAVPRFPRILVNSMHTSSSLGRGKGKSCLPTQLTEDPMIRHYPGTWYLTKDYCWISADYTAYGTVKCYRPTRYILYVTPEFYR